MTQFYNRRKWSILSGLLVAGIFYGCSKRPENNINGTRIITVFFDPSYSSLIEKYPVKATLNGVKLLDTLIVNTHKNSSLKLTCFPVDTGKENILLLTVLNKTIKTKLNKYKTPCVSAFYRYDDHVRLDSMFQKYTASSIKSTGKIPDYKEYADKLKAQYRHDRYDSIYMDIQKRCLCDSD